MIRLFVEEDLGAGAGIELARAPAHYLAHVMRQKAGDEIALFNGRDGEWRAAISSIGKNSAALSVLDQTRMMKPGPDVWLVFAPVKRARIDLIAEKATELGVSALCPVFTEYTAMSRVNTDRLRANAVEAAEQSRRLDVPTIHSAQKISDLLANWPADRRCLYCDETGAGRPIASVLGDAREQQATSPWAILVGPEGGFSLQELDRFSQQINFTPVGLGPRILRAETAALAALTCWQATMGDW